MWPQRGGAPILTVETLAATPKSLRLEAKGAAYAAFEKPFQGFRSAGRQAAAQFGMSSIGLMVDRNHIQLGSKTRRT